MAAIPDALIPENRKPTLVDIVEGDHEGITQSEQRFLEGEGFEILEKLGEVFYPKSKFCDLDINYDVGKDKSGLAARTSGSAVEGMGTYFFVGESGRVIYGSAQSSEFHLKRYSHSVEEVPLWEYQTRLAQIKKERENS